MPGPAESLQTSGEEMQKQEDSGSWEVIPMPGPQRIFMCISETWRQSSKVEVNSKGFGGNTCVEGVPVALSQKLFLQTRNLPEKQMIMSLPNRAVSRPCLSLCLSLACKAGLLVNEKA